MRKLFGNGRYANVAATLALFIALGGTSYAALTLPANSVSTRQIKKGAVTLNRLSEGAQHSLKGAKGERGATGATGPAGPSGAPGNTSVLYAYVAETGGNVITRSSPGASSFMDGTGVYYVTFPGHNLTNCALQATIGGDANQGNPSGEIGARMRDDLHTDTVTVDTFGDSGSHTPQPFFITAFC